MKKSSVEMICDIGELAGLFADRSNVNGFLFRVVKIIANHMKADVCSIYLWDETRQNLSLEATIGLNPAMVGRINLSMGEGITGLALKELRTVREDRGRNNPNFIPVDGIGEEDYEAFLAVPILRGIERIGVLVVQHKKPGFFDQQDSRALKAIATQLATSLENAKLLMALNSSSEEDTSGDVSPMTTVKKEAVKDLYRGKSTVAGFAFGSAYVLEKMGLEEIQDSENFRASQEGFEEALEKTEKQLEALQQLMEEKYSDVASLIFSAHILMLRDSGFSGTMRDRIAQGTPPCQAVVEVVKEYVTIFSQSHNQRMQEKVQDVKDLGHRILQNLLRSETSRGDYKGLVVIARELYPSELIKMSAQNAEGLILLGTGASAHVSILAKSMNIPVLFIEDESIFSLTEQDYIILDGHQGSVLINPDEKIQTEYNKLASGDEDLDHVAQDVSPQTITRDGEKITLMANINLLSELSVATKLKAEGVGLYRSEFPFIVRNDFPSEEEQFRVYSKILDAMPGKEVILRTLDIGGDKVLSYLPTSGESNPFLGLRAIRFSLRNKDIFLDQLRAMLRAGAGRELSIMFPLISSLDDFLEARDMVYLAVETLAMEDFPFNDNPKIGAMIELPSAVEVVDELAKDADFLCIGSNDLVQYLLGVDRTNEEVSSLYISHHPAVFRTLKRISQASIRQDCPLSICGEIAADPYIIPFLLGIGIEKISVNPKQIPEVQKIIENVEIQECRDESEKLLAMGTLKEVNRYLGLTSS